MCCVWQSHVFLYSPTGFTHHFYVFYPQIALKPPLFSPQNSIDSKLDPILMLLDTDLLDELIEELEDLTLEDEIEDCTTDLLTLSEMLEMFDEVAETLFTALSCTLFSAFCTKLD